tara:strand:- start:949 stop:1158 length:210 start_codon:yes stop_codon:yes gene_type:complete
MSNEDCELENLKVENQKLGKQIEFLKRSLEKAVKQGLEEIERRQFAELEVTKIKKEMKISLNDIRKSGL